MIILDKQMIYLFPIIKEYNLWLLKDFVIKMYYSSTPIFF